MNLVLRGGGRTGSALLHPALADLVVPIFALTASWLSSHSSRDCHSIRRERERTVSSG